MASGCTINKIGVISQSLNKLMTGGSMFTSVIKSFPEALLTRLLNVLGVGSLNHMNQQSDAVPFWAEERVS